MLNINSPPVIKHEALRATIGVDSVHISIKMNRCDLERFCKDNDYV